MAEGPTTSNHASRPAGMNEAWRFALFNALSFQIVLGSPMILYAKTLHAHATVLGIIAGMMPLMVIFQIPAAQYIPRFGYKKFVVTGWGTRTVFTLGMVFVPLATGLLDVTTLLVLMLALLFAFNLVRGITSCAWMPWITHLIPENYRGRYLSGDIAMVNLGSFLTVVLSALCLGATPKPWQFAVIFAFSAITGTISLLHLNRMPDVPITGAARSSSEPIPWGAIVKHPPFRKLLKFAVVWAVAYGGLNAFTVAFLKTGTKLAEGQILLVTSVAFLGGLSSLWFLGHRLDHVGSKPVLGLSLSAWLLILLGWLAIAGGVLPASVPLILTLYFVMGLFAALTSMATSRLAMAVVPTMGRNHFFVLYSVATGLALGLSPIAWGLIIDLIGARHFRFAGVDWNHYSIFYLLVFVAFAMTLALAHQLQENKAATFGSLLTEIVIELPQRLWLRLWPRE
jgi:MFS family permease